MSDHSDLAEAPRPEPAVPRAVVRAQVLLRVQALFWGVAAAGALAVLAANAHAIVAGHSAAFATWLFAVGVIVLALLAGMAAVSAFLAAGLKRGSGNARVATVVLEIFMTCFGLLIVGAADPSGGVPADIPLLAGLVGAVLSCAAAVGLMRAPARRFAAR